MKHMWMLLHGAMSRAVAGGRGRRSMRPQKRCQKVVARWTVRAVLEDSMMNVFVCIIASFSE